MIRSGPLRKSWVLLHTDGRGIYRSNAHARALYTPATGALRDRDAESTTPNTGKVKMERPSLSYGWQFGPHVCRGPSTLLECARQADFMAPVF